MLFKFNIYIIRAFTKDLFLPIFPNQKSQQYCLENYCEHCLIVKMNLVFAKFLTLTSLPTLFSAYDPKLTNMFLFNVLTAFKYRNA